MDKMFHIIIVAFNCRIFHMSATEQYVHSFPLGMNYNHKKWHSRPTRCELLGTYLPVIDRGLVCLLILLSGGRTKSKRFVIR
jgi:hypothetical protein